MKITTITYNRTVNLGNYESKRLEATCQVDEGENPSDAADELRASVLHELMKPRPGNGN